MSPERLVQQIDTLFSHVWMVRCFLKHSDEAEDDEELAEVHRQLYDVMLSLGSALQSGDPSAYLKQARKKLTRLRRAAHLFAEIQPEVSTHTNFRMAAQSLTAAVAEIESLLSSSPDA